MLKNEMVVCNSNTKEREVFTILQDVKSLAAGGGSAKFDGESNIWWHLTCNMPLGTFEGMSHCVLIEWCQGLGGMLQPKQPDCHMPFTLLRYVPRCGKHDRYGWKPSPEPELCWKSCQSENSKMWRQILWSFQQTDLTASLPFSCFKFSTTDTFLQSCYNWANTKYSNWILVQNMTAYW